MTIEPLNDRVIIRRSEEVISMTEGGLIIPDAAREKPQEGDVIAVGSGKFEEGHVRPLGVKVGDRVLFGKYAGSVTKLNGEELLIMREDEILAILRND